MPCAERLNHARITIATRPQCCAQNVGNNQQKGAQRLEWQVQAGQPAGAILEPEPDPVAVVGHGPGG